MFKKGLLFMNKVEKIQDLQSVEYYEVITYYYGLIGNRSVKKGYGEKKAFNFLSKLEEWERVYEDSLDEMGA